MEKPPENRLNVEMCQSMIAALRYIETELMQPDAPGAVVISSFSDKFWCTGIDLNEAESNRNANADGFCPLVTTLLDYPFPTVAMVTGHTFGGGCPFMLSCDYRVMNSQRGFISMPAVDLGLHFDGIGSIVKAKLTPRVARKMLLEGHKWTGKQALEDGVVDEVAEPAKMRDKAVELAAKHSIKAKTGIYGLMRAELLGEALEKWKLNTYTHRKRVGLAPKFKL